MADVKWIKIVTDIFDDEKILLIESMPDGDSIIVIWFKLLCLAGKNNNEGVFIMNDRIAYTDEMLAAIFRRNINTVRMALKTFEEFNMIDIIDGIITIPNWGKHQDFEKIKARQEYMKLYMRNKRAEQRALITASDDKNDEVNDNVNNTVNNAVNVNNNINNNANVNNDVNVNKTANVNVNEMSRKRNVSALEEDIDIDINNINISKDISSDKKLTDEQKQQSNTAFKHLIDSWNTLEAYGITPIRTITPNTKRATLVRARIKQHGEAALDEAIEQIKCSDFLQGKHKGAPWQITFDWFIAPTNFLKVWEGNYKNPSLQQMEEQPLPPPQHSSKVKNIINLESAYSTEELTELERKLLDN